MTREEIIAWQEAEKKFSATAVGKAFNKFRNAFQRVQRAEWDDNLNPRTAQRWDDEAKQAEKELKDEIRRLLAKAGEA